MTPAVEVATRAQDLSGPAVLDMRGDTLHLDQTPHEAVRTTRQQTEIESTAVVVLDEAHRRSLQLITTLAPADETETTLTPSSLHVYLPRGYAKDAWRRAFVLLADDTWNALSATSSTLFEFLVSRPQTRTRVEDLVVGDAVELPGEAVAQEPPAYLAFKDLARWLEADQADIATMVGVGRTTPGSWVRDKREPRAATVRRLYQYHSTLKALARRLGDEGLREWIFTGSPMPRQLLLDGDLEGVEREVDMIVFDKFTDRLPDLAWAPEPADSEPQAAQPGPQTPGPSGRRPRRARPR